MSKTLRFGSRSSRADLEKFMLRVDRHVMRRHTTCGFDRMQELAAQDYARHVALQVTPQMNRNKPVVTFSKGAPGFGKRHPLGS